MLLLMTTTDALSASSATKSLLLDNISKSTYILTPVRDLISVRSQAATLALGRQENFQLIKSKSTALSQVKRLRGPHKKIVRVTLDMTVHSEPSILLKQATLFRSNKAKDTKLIASSRFYGHSKRIFNNRKYVKLSKDALMLVLKP